MLQQRDLMSHINIIHMNLKWNWGSYEASPEGCA